MILKLLPLFAYLLVFVNTETIQDKVVDDKLTASATTNDHKQEPQDYGQLSSSATGNEDYHQINSNNNNNNNNNNGANYGHLSYNQVNGKQQQDNYGANNYDQSVNDDYQNQPNTQEHFESAKVDNNNYGVKGGRAAVVEPLQQVDSGLANHQGYDQNQANNAPVYNQGNGASNYYSTNNAGNSYKTQEVQQPVTTYGGFKPIVNQEGGNQAYVNSHFQQGDAQPNVIQYSPQQHDNNYQAQAQAQAQAYPQDYQQQQPQYEQQQPQYQQPVAPQYQQQPQYDYQQPDTNQKVHFQYETNIGHQQAQPEQPVQNVKQQEYPLAGHVADYSGSQPYAGNAASKPYSTEYVSGVNIVKPISYQGQGEEKSFQRLPGSEIVQGGQVNGAGYTNVGGAQEINYDKSNLDSFYDSEIKKILAQYQSPASSGYSQIPSTSASTFQTSEHNSPVNIPQGPNYSEVPSGASYTGSDTMSSFPNGGSLSSSFSASGSSSSFPVTNTLTDYSATSSLSEYPNAALLSNTDIPATSLNKGYNFGLGHSYGFGQNSLFGYPAYQQQQQPSSQLSLGTSGSTPFQSYIPQTTYFNANNKYRPTGLFGGTHYQPHSSLSTYAAAASSKLSEVIKAPFKSIRDALFRNKAIG